MKKKLTPQVMLRLLKTIEADKTITNDYRLMISDQRLALQVALASKDTRKAFALMGEAIHIVRLVSATRLADFLL